MLLPGVKTPATHRVRGCVGPTAGLPGPFGKTEKNPLLLPEKKNPESPARSLVGVSNIAKESDCFLRDVPVSKGRVG